MIQTRDGEKAIQDIKIGDWVLSDDPTTPGDIDYKQVVQTFVHETNYLVDIYIGGEKITTTEGHPFWVKDVGWVAARDLDAGAQLQTKSESWLGVERVEKHTEVATVYNFEVAGFHTYFVSDLGLLVHNSCPVRRAQNPNDITAPSERAARRAAFRDMNIPTSRSGKPFERIPDYNPNPNIRGAKGEPAEIIRTTDSNGKTVDIAHHSNGHSFNDVQPNQYELPHYHGEGGNGHFSYEP